MTLSSPPTLLVGPAGGQTIQLVATATTADGAVRPSVRIRWASSSVGTATVSASGVVTAVHPGFTNVTATVGSVVGTVRVNVAQVPVATVAFAADSLALERNILTGSAPHQLAVQFRDSSGALLTDRPVIWTSTHPAVASVTSGGLVTAVSAGMSQVIAGSEEGRADTIVVTVTDVGTLPADANLAITAANWTQAVQNAAGTIPLVADGRAAVLNVLLSTTHDIAAPGLVVLRLLDAAGAVVHAESASVVVSRAATASWMAPTVQFLVPSRELRAGRRWEVVRDPGGALRDADSADDRWPRSQAGPLDVWDVPPIRIRFIPIVLTSHGNSTGDVTAANLSEYMRVVRAVLPLGPIEITVGDPLTSDRSFGVAPTGGDATFWTGVLSDVDAARVADPAYADAHWIGVVRPPVGFNFTTFGGFGYVPANGTSFSPATRSAVLVTVGWFTRESQTRELVAHELGHTLGRRHAPCGNPAGPDPNFPNAGGVIGDFAHDVNAWALGLASAAAAVPAANGDIMGYCTPVWVSAYTYSGMLQFRGQAVTAERAIVAGASAQRRARALLVRGTERGGVLALEPAVALDLAATGSEVGDHVVTGRSATGAVLFRRAFPLVELDHDPSARAFAVSVPVDDATMAALASIEVRGPAGSATRTLASRWVDAPPVIRRAGTGAVVTCPDGTQSTTVQDAGSDRVLAWTRGAEARLRASPPRAIRVTCGDGVRSRATVIAPQ